MVTTRRGLIVIALAAGALLIVSQFLDFQAIEVGRARLRRRPGHHPGSPPGIRDTDGQPFELLLVIAGLVAVLAAAGAALAGNGSPGSFWRWPGAAALAVALLVDLPAGLDTADAELAFAGVNGVLLSGFWLEIGAGAVLVVSGIGLVLDAPAPKRVRSAAA